MIEITVRIYGDEVARDELALNLERRLRDLGKKHDFEVGIRRLPGKKPRRDNRAEGFLRMAFDEDLSPLSRNRLMESAAEQGITPHQLNYAKRKLQMKSIRRGPGKSILWGPPGSALGPVTGIPDL